MIEQRIASYIPVLQMARDSLAVAPEKDNPDAISDLVKDATLTVERVLLHVYRDLDAAIVLPPWPSHEDRKRALAEIDSTEEDLVWRNVPILVERADSVILALSQSRLRGGKQDDAQGTIQDAVHGGRRLPEPGRADAGDGGQHSDQPSGADPGREAGSDRGDQAPDGSSEPEVDHQARADRAEAALAKAEELIEQIRSQPQAPVSSADEGGGNPFDEFDPRDDELAAKDVKIAELQAALDERMNTPPAEPMPDPLQSVLDGLKADEQFMEQFEKAHPDLGARLRQPNPDDEARKAALMQRFIDLQGLERLGAIKPAGWAEFEQLTAYASWFR